MMPVGSHVEQRQPKARAELGANLKEEQSGGSGNDNLELRKPVLKGICWASKLWYADGGDSNKFKNQICEQQWL